MKVYHYIFLTGKRDKKYWLWTFLQRTLIFFAVHFWSDPTERMSREHQGPSPQSNGWEHVPFCRRYADLCTATECWAPELLPWPPSWSTCHREQDIILDIPGHSKKKKRFCYETVWQRQTAHFKQPIKRGMHLSPRPLLIVTSLSMPPVWARARAFSIFLLVTSCSAQQTAATVSSDSREGPLPGRRVTRSRMAYFPIKATEFRKHLF